jgi:hypothetical protein
MLYYSEIMRYNQIYEESTTGSSKIYNVVIQHENDRCRLWLHARLPIHSSSQSHLKSPQVSSVPPPPCKYDMPTHHNTTMLTKHSIYESSYFVNVLQTLYCGPQFETEFKEENLTEEYHAMLIITHKIIEKPKFYKSLYIYILKIIQVPYFYILYCFNIIKICDSKQGAL